MDGQVGVSCHVGGQMGGWAHRWAGGCEYVGGQVGGYVGRRLDWQVSGLVNWSAGGGVGDG